MTPDYEKAASMALETLIKHKITAAPIDPLAIVKRTEGVLAMPFAELACNAGIERSNLVPMFGMNQDAVTFYINADRVRYVVAYNQYLPFDMLRRGLARELGHIVMGHDGTRPPEIRMAESMCFAKHLIFPRPLIHAIQESGIPFTVEVIGSVTGCYDRCLSCLRKQPGVKTPAELNRAVKEQFADCIQNFIAFEKYLTKSDHSALADFGSFMENYEE